MTKRLPAVFILIAYCAILIKVMVFKEVPLIRLGPLKLNFGGTHEGPANLIPFKTILSYLLAERGLMIAAINLIGNIALLVPIGLLLPFVWRNITWKKSLALAIACGFAIEGMQVLLHVGIFDIDDVLLNALGVMIGYWTATVLIKWVRAKKYKTIAAATIVLIGIAAAAIYFVYPGGQRVNEETDPGRVDAVAVQSDRLDSTASKVSQGIDPCNGTGGAGEIISVGNNTITIKRRDGSGQLIKLMEKATIRTSTGAGSIADLKVGKRVTLVGDSNPDRSFTAHTVIVCNA